MDDILEFILHQVVYAVFDLLIAIVLFVFIYLSWTTGFLIVKAFSLGNVQIAGPKVAFIRTEGWRFNKKRDKEEIEWDQRQGTSEKSIMLGAVLWIALISYGIFKYVESNPF